MYTLIKKQAAFDDLCARVADVGQVAFDTEFVSEHHYRPRLCLLQLAVDSEYFVVDPFEIDDLGPWWELMIDPQVQIIIHGGREEIRFCEHFAGRPANLVDVQIAQGLLSRGFPLSHRALLERVVGITVHGHETRTDWSRRPLSDRQTEYAVDDVRHLNEVWDRQRTGLDKLGRLDWAFSEFERLIDAVEAERDREGWRRLPKIHKLSSRQLATARELYDWREATAEEEDRPVRQVLRDDLIIELSRRNPQSVQELLELRDMKRRNYRRHADAMLAAIDAARAIPKSELPRWNKSRPTPDHEDVIGRLLAIALANQCAAQEISMTLVGTSSDLQDLVRWHVFDEQQGPPPKLATGWRTEVCGQLLEDLMDGRVALRVADPESDHPLIFEPVPEDGV